MTSLTTDTSEKTPLSRPNDDVEEVVAVTTTKFEMANGDEDELGNIPSDKRNVVLLVMMLHGFGALIAWNSFISIAPTYFKGYKLESAFASNSSNVEVVYPGYIRNFMNYVCLCSQLPNLTVNAIGLFVDKGNLFRRITVSLIIIICSCLFTVVFIFVDTSNWPFGFFVITMLTVIVLNSANGVYQNSIFGIVGSFPMPYINAVILGNNICGLVITLLLVVTTQTFNNPQINAAVYFSIALLALVFCLVSIFYLQKNHFYVHQIAIERKSSQNRAVYTLTDYIKTFQEFWLPLLNVWAVFFVTLFLFPSVLLDIHLYPTTRHTGKIFDFHNLSRDLYGILFVFLNFNFFSVIGSKLADYFKWPSRKYVVIPIALRFLFIPLFYMANYSPGNYRTWSVLIQNEYVVFILIALMSTSHGYYSSVAMMYAPSTAEPSKARIIGKMSAFFLVLGIASGIAASFVAEYPVHW